MTLVENINPRTFTLGGSTLSARTRGWWPWAGPGGRWSWTPGGGREGSEWHKQYNGFIFLGINLNALVQLVGGLVASL